MSRIQKFFVKWSMRYEENRVLNEIAESFVTLIPIFIIGAFATLLRNIPIPEVASFLEEVFDGALYKGLGLVYDATFGVSAVYVVILLSFRYSMAITKKFSNINIMTVITSVVSYFVLIAGEYYIDATGMSVQVFLQKCTSERNIFIAVLTAVISSYITVKIYGRVMRCSNENRLYTDFSRSLKAIFPSVVTISIFVILSVIIQQFTQYRYLGESVVELFNTPFTKIGQNIVSGIVVIFLVCVSWFFGIHGNNTFKEVTAVIFPDGCESIFSKTFLDTYVMIGGCGTTIALIIACLIFSKNKENRKVVSSAVLPGIFNINEIVIFGLPIVLNPVFIVPFVLAPVVSFLIAYGATSAGLVPMVTNSTNWTTPAIASGYITTGSWKGAILQVVIILVSVIIYIPFVKMYNNVQKILLEDKIKRISDYVRQCESKNADVDFTQLPDKLVKVVASLGEKLYQDVESNNIVIHYQPQIDNEEKVVSSEALLRWKGDTDNVVYPPLVIEISREYGVYNKLTKEIITMVLKDVVKIHEEIGEYVPVSVNIDMAQLVDESFIEWIFFMVKHYQLPDNTLGLEITEHSNIVETADFADVLRRFREHGIVVSIDDFSMGYTSLAYLQMNQFDYIKLDGGIVKNIEKNERSKEIVDSLISLGKSLGFGVVAEYVENEKLQNMLHDMGCNKYQGYLYSPAVNVEEYIEYIRKLNETK